MTTNTGIPDKNTGDTFTAAEFNLMNNAINNFSGGNIFPVFEYDETYPQPSMVNTPLTIRRLSGFEGDGDMIQLPSTGAGSQLLVYYDASGNQVTDGVWNGGLAASEIHVNATHWVSFSLSADGSLLYVVCIDSSPATLYTATINKLGVMTLIGTATATTYDYNANSTWPYTSMNRGPTGGGNLFLHNYSGHMSEIDISTGQFVSEYVQQTIIQNPYWKTANGNYLGLNGGTTAGSTTLNYVQGASGQALALIPWANGGNSSNSRILLDWRGRVVFTGNSTGSGFNGRAMTYAQINKFGDDLAAVMGVD